MKILTVSIAILLGGCSSLTTPHLVRDMSKNEVQFIKTTGKTCPVCSNALTAINQTIRRKCLKTLTVNEMKKMQDNSPLYSFVVALNSLNPPMEYTAKIAINGMDCLNYNDGLYKTALPIYKQNIKDRKQKASNQQHLDQWLQAVMRM
ncbi:hypothetical protein [Photobacterium toruni]|uniref:hypothetical protein n=1 Tax=Photobacterium toruni TaxID=1935446 RepID=UPI00210F5F3B|nr:hypothetical protein [Photobacterium toruni]